jgi:hypothetical protein
MQRVYHQAPGSVHRLTQEATLAQAQALAMQEVLSLCGCLLQVTSTTSMMIFQLLKVWVLELKGFRKEVTSRGRG